MRIAVTGRSGQVAQSLIEMAPAAGHVVVPVARPQLDLATGTAESVWMALAEAAPDVIVSAAAYTAVDKAEAEPHLAYAVNATGAGYVAQAAARLRVPLVHLSTDYVFGGQGEGAWLETDAPGPVGVYGASKLAGEQAVLSAQPNTAVLRTAWVYSPFGNNFVKTMLRLATDRSEISVVSDQTGNPTSAFDIAWAVIRVAENLVSDTAAHLRGVFHMAGTGDTNWAEFAKAIFAESGSLGGPAACVRAITTADYPTAAVRPANSRLNCALLEKVHGIRLPHWRDALPVVIARLDALRRDEK